MSSSRHSRMVFVGNWLLPQSMWEIDTWFSPRFRSITSLPAPFRKSISASFSREKKKIYGGKAIPWISTRGIRKRFFQCWNLDAVFLISLSCERYLLFRWLNLLIRPMIHCLSYPLQYHGKDRSLDVVLCQKSLLSIELPSCQRSSPLTTCWHTKTVVNDNTIMRCVSLFSM
jgi:hypothetical protein